ncbi:hypothetical protein Tco_0285737 [Tanacetum coccineum]
MEATRGGKQTKFQKQAQVGPEARQILTPYKDPERNFRFRKRKIQGSPPMVICEFHADTGHGTDECMQLRKQIDEIIEASKLSQFIKELKQNDKPKAPKKDERKDH